MEVISLNGVSKSFGEKNVLKDINLSVGSGELIGLVGKSGSGKSVLIKMIIGFLKPDSGSIVMNKSEENSINFSMQGNSIYDHLTVKQNLDYFSKIYGLSRESRKKIIPYLIGRLNLDLFENVIVKKLSGGTQKRVDIACALLNNPRILVLDEPFLGLDPELVKIIGEFILELNKGGRTIIISSHDLIELNKICSRFILVKEGNLVPLDKNQIKKVYN